MLIVKDEHTEMTNMEEEETEGKSYFEFLIWFSYYYNGYAKVFADVYTVFKRYRLIIRYANNFKAWPVILLTIFA